MEKYEKLDIFDNKLDYAGQSFHELSEEEMSEIIGGNISDPIEQNGLISTLASGFVLSWLGSAALRCK